MVHSKKVVPFGEISLVNLYRACYSFVFFVLIYSILWYLKNKMNVGCGRGFFHCFLSTYIEFANIYTLWMANKYKLLNIEIF